MRIPLERLHLSGQLGAGSQGAIFGVEGGSDLGFPFPLIYKEFSSTTVVSGASLEVLARFRADLDDGDRRVLDLRTVWPCAVVAKEAKVVGYVMQRIPADFEATIQTSSGPEPIPREVQHLFVADAISRKNLGEVPKRTERLALARQAAFILGFLHRHDFIFGDVSYKNAVYTLRPRPMVMLLDCDAVRKRGQGAAVPQLNSPGWGAPEKGPQTIETDRYKLGLFILRCLTPGVNAQNRDPEKAAHVLDEDGLALLRRSLAADPPGRPSGKEWVTYLDARIEAAGGVRPRTAPADAPAAPPAIARRRPATSPPPPRPTVRAAARPPSPGTRSPVNLPPPAPAPALPTNIVRVPRPRPFGQPKGAPAVPPGQGWVHPKPIKTGHVRAGSGLSSWAGYAPGTPAAGSTGGSRLTGRQMIVILLWTLAVAGIVLALVLGLALALSPKGASKASPPTPRAPVVQASARSDSARSAVQRVLAVAPTGSKLARLASGGTPDPAAVREAPTTWRITVVDPTKVGADGTTVVQTYEVGTSAVGPPASAPMALGGVAGNRSVPVLAPDDWRSDLDTAIGTFEIDNSSGMATSIAFRCSPTASSTADCAWVFTQDRANGNPNVVFVGDHGRRVLPRPTWA